MKKLIISVFLGIALLMLVPSCDSFLEIDYYTILPPDHIFTSEANIQAGLIGCYDSFYPTRSTTGIPNDLYHGLYFSWVPQFKIYNHPTMDTQAGGWDAMFNYQGWGPDNPEFGLMWMWSYRAINTCNEFLVGLKGADPLLFSSLRVRDEIEAQARAIRAYNYYVLAKNFGRVPMLEEGENYSNTPGKPRPTTDRGTWDYIISELEWAASILDWTPVDGKYGRVTKGFCLGYLAEAYMYIDNYTEAKRIYKEIIDDGPYELLPCYSYLFDSRRAWTKEDVWAIVLWEHVQGGQGSTGWGPAEDHYAWISFNTASGEYGGWGSLYISWEVYESFEPGDRRRQASMVALGEENPWTQQTIGAGTNAVFHGYKTAEFLPNVFTTKWWRNRPGSAYDFVDRDGNVTRIPNWVFPPTALRYLRYSHILLNYAECCFRTGEEAIGWQQLDLLRNRAWGNLEVVKGLSVSDHLYPIPMLETAVNVPSAQEYYTQYKANKGYNADVGILAVNMERRKEHNSEFTFFSDLKRSGMIEEFVNIEYPRNNGYNPATHPAEARNDKRTFRSFEFSSQRMTFPIPQMEILANPHISPSDQNPGY